MEKRKFSKKFKIIVPLGALKKNYSPLPNYFQARKIDLKLLFVIILFLFFQNSIFGQNLDSLVNALESALDKHQIFDRQKEDRIKHLLAKISQTENLKEHYHIYDDIYIEYQFYNFDKALTFIEENIQIGKKLNDKLFLNEAKLKLGLLLINSGRYKESIDALNGIKRDSLPQTLINEYYIAYKEGYSGLSYKTVVKRSQSTYLQLYKAYQDSLYSRLKPDSEEALRLKEKQYRDNRNLDMALKVNSERLSKVKMGVRGFSLITFERSLLYELTNNLKKQKEYLILSAISDIKAAVKDNASIGTLAKIMFIEGDIDRAHRYINHSYEDVEFYNSPLRYVDIANSMPLITKGYEEKTAKQKRKLQQFLIFISILAAFLLVAIYLVFRQVKQVSNTRNKLKIANQSLNQTNEDLKRLYKELSEIDKIKEQYIGTFLNLYSEYITKLDVYRKLVRKYVNTNQMNSLLKLSKSKQFIEEELQIFNENFDSSFLHIYPDFVLFVNQLLKPDAQIILDDPSKLNTELRILALIKLGITSSSQIAKILRYSVNTIYNYRAAIKGTAINRSTFEEKVKKIP